MKTLKLLPLVLASFAGGAVFAADTAGTKVDSPIADKTYDLQKIFAGKLLDAEGKPVKTDDIGKTPYTLVYYSAHWCPPCRAFTPKLVKFVNENRKDGNFSIAFVSSDHSQKDMQGYIKETKMPWGGVMKGDIKSSGISAGVSGIPCLRVFDKDGKVVFDSFDKKDEYTGPGEILEKFAAKLKK